MESTICHDAAQPKRKIDLDSHSLQKMITIFKALAEPKRLQIIYALIQEGALCVCEIAQIINSSNATASHHLNYLKEQKLAKSERRGKQVYYQIADEHVQQLVEIVQAHAEED